MILVPLLIVAAGTTAVAIPYVFTQVRDATKERRRGIIDDLDKGFKLTHDYSDTTIASFEFVKYKYFLDERNNMSRDFSPFEWVVGSLPLVATLCFGNSLFLLIITHAIFKIALPVGIVWLDGTAGLSTFGWTFLAAYTGGLLFMLRAFNQAINNFDLSPLSFVGAVLNLAFGLALALLIAFAALHLLGVASVDTSGSARSSSLILTSFLAGYFPDVALRTVLRLGHLRLYKSEKESVYKAFQAVPVEIIDGIDSDIRTRLADYHINSVQNLATANPLMLFVETPFGVYEIVDWVAQAQLCASVGPDALLSFWKLGIRTIFDLERVALDSVCRDDNLLLEIGAILWRDQGEDQKVADGRKAAGLTTSPALPTIVADLRFRLENLHVIRLRQIFNRVSKILASDSGCLPSLRAYQCGDAPSLPGK